MNLTIMNFDKERYDTGIPTDQVNEIDVTVVSGDEIIVVLQKNGKIAKIDAAKLGNTPRLLDYYDGSYIVYKEEVEIWNNREDTYEWIGRSVFDDVI